MTWLGSLAAVALASAILLAPARGAGAVERARTLIPRRGAPTRAERKSAALVGRVVGRAAGRVVGERRPGRDGATGREVAAFLDGVAAALDAGLPVVAAVECASEVSGVGGPSSVVGQIVAAAHRGDVHAGVWDDLATALEDTGAADVLRDVAQVWRICESTGSPMAAALRCAAAAARTHADRTAGLAVATAGPRATIRLLTVLPLLGPAGVLLVWSGGPVPAGVATVAAGSTGAGLVLLLVGHRWARRIVAHACLPAPAAPVVGGPSGAWPGRAI